MSEETVLVEIFHDEKQNYDWFSLEIKCNGCEILLGVIDMTFKPNELNSGFNLSVNCIDCQAQLEDEIE